MKLTSVVALTLSLSACSYVEHEHSTQLDPRLVKGVQSVEARLRGIESAIRGEKVVDPAEVSALEADLGSVRQELEHRRQMATAERERAEELANRLAIMEREAADANAAVHAANERAQADARRIEELECKLTDHGTAKTIGGGPDVQALRDRIEILQRDVREAQKERSRGVADDRAALSKLDAEVRRAKDEVAAARREVERAVRVAREREDGARQARKRISELERALAVAQASADRSRQSRDAATRAVETELAHAVRELRELGAVVAKVKDTAREQQSSLAAELADARGGLQRAREAASVSAKVRQALARSVDRLDQRARGLAEDLEAMAEHRCCTCRPNGCADSSEDGAAKPTRKIN